MLPKDGKPAAPKGRTRSLREISLVRKWITQGAKDDTPASAKTALVDMDHPPAYVLPPVVTSIAYSPGSDLLAVAGYHEILMHKADGSGLVARLVGLSERIQAVAFSPDGKRIAAAGGSPGRFGEIQVWDIASEKLKLAVTMTADTLYGVALNG